MAHYVDTSALVKLVVVEPESAALSAWLTEADRVPVASDLARTELLRVVRRFAPDRVVRVRAVLDSLTLTEVTTALFEAAGRLDPRVCAASTLCTWRQPWISATTSTAW